MARARPLTLRVIRKLGLTPVMWNVTCYDWKPTTPERILAHVERQMRGGDVILLHDGGHIKMGADRSHSVEATDMMVRRCRGQGREFVSVSEMINRT